VKKSSGVKNKNRFQGTPIEVKSGEERKGGISRKRFWKGEKEIAKTRQTPLEAASSKKGSTKKVLGKC